MAVREGTRASAEFMCISLVPDFCKSPTIPVPYKILSTFDCAIKFSTNVRFRTQWVFRHNSRLATVRCDEPGVGGGVLSGVNMGFCRPIDGTSSTTVRVNGSFVDYHEGTYMFMNCAGPEGPFNTLGRVVFLGNMLPGPVAPGPKVPKSCIGGMSGIMSDIQSSLGDVDDLIAKGKQLYSLAQTDWSDPSAVLGAIGGVAGIAGLQDVAKTVGQAKELYDTGKKILTTDWSDPKQALAAVAGAANVLGMEDVAKVAGLANMIRDTIKTDWSDPKAALAAATNIMKSTGLNQMAAQMLSNTILDNNIPVSQNGTTPPFFPKPGSSASSNASSAANPSASNTIPPSKEGLNRTAVTPDFLNYLKDANPVAFSRFNSMTRDEQAKAFVETQKSSGSDDKTSDNDRTAIYMPGEGFSATKADLDGLPNVSSIVPQSIREFFVAGKEPSGVGSFFGIKEKEGNAYLFGGLVDLGSPGMPGAGTVSSWWVPDRLLNMDMSPYYDYHDKGYYGDNVTLSGLGNILEHEWGAFKAGVSANPLQLPLQALYSGATTAVGIKNALVNSMSNIMSGDFPSMSDFYNSVFGSTAADPSSLITSFAPGGCMPGDVPMMPGKSAPGTGSGAPGSGAPPKPGTAGAAEGAASGAGKDGVLITTKQGNPAAAAAMIEAQFRAENQAALDKAQAEERAKQEQAAKEKAAKEKAANEKSGASNDAKSSSAEKPKDGNEEGSPSTNAEDPAKNKKERELVKTTDPYYNNRFTQEELDEINRVKAMSADEKLDYHSKLKDRESWLEEMKSQGKIHPDRYAEYKKKLESDYSLYNHATADGSTVPVITDNEIRSGLSTGLDMAPVLGNVKSAYEAGVGTNPVTGEPLTPEERALAAMGVALPAVKGVKNLGMAGRVAQHADDFGDAIKVGSPAYEAMSAAEKRAFHVSRGVPENQIGPSGKPKIHTVEKPTLKEAQNAAREAGAGKPIKHTQDEGQSTHFHAVDAEGVKLSGKDNVHYKKRGD